MIIRDDEIQGRFKDLLNTHTRVDIATAWATGGEHLRMLAEATKREQRPVRVRAMVGTAGNATRPDALKALHRITNGDLRIIKDRTRLFHPKLYLFGWHMNGSVGSHAWVGSANFTNAGFGGQANEEMLVEIDPGETTAALAVWFQERWNDCPTDRPVEELIDEYTEDWKQNPPHRDVREFVSGVVSRRSDLLDDAHRPQSLQEYRQALEKCEELLRDEGRNWKVLDPQGQSYMSAISERRRILLGEARWWQLDGDQWLQLKGGGHSGDSRGWGLLGRMARSHEKAVRDHGATIQRVLDNVVPAGDTAFPDIAVDALQKLTRIDNVAHGTATLLLALARPDRLVSLNGASEEAYSRLSRMSRWTLGKPQNYGKLLQWLYDQPWYTDSRPRDEALEKIWRFRAALVDAFVYSPK